MKILLVGEYSSVHTELSLALKQLGHQVTTLSDGDAFKGFVPDIYFGVTAQSSVVKKIFRSILDFLGIKGLTLLFQKRKILAKCQGYDVVQLINPVTLEPLGALANILFINYLSRKNKKLFLCALGDDYSWVSACLEGRYKYSPLDRISIKTLINYRYSLRYVYGFFYRSLDKYVKKKCSAIIPGLLDYKMAHADCHKLTDLIPLPVNIKNFHPPKKKAGPVKIFHGWQAGKENRKGNDILDKAVKEAAVRVGSGKIAYVIAKNLPFDVYVKQFLDCDIFLDQIYSYDVGVNGALGMAAGKVVFSGFEFYEKHDQSETKNIKNIGVNATPDLEELIEMICILVTNEELRESIKLNAYEFANKTYKSTDVAGKYLTAWSV